jgi:hypothetical protein
LTSAVAGGVAVADFLEAAAPSLARCAILIGARSELGGLLFSIVDFSESCRDGISFATADVATSSRPDAAMAMKWYMIATSYLQTEACKIAAWRVRRKPLRSNSLESMITFRASVAPKDLRLNLLSRAVPPRAGGISPRGSFRLEAGFTRRRSSL